MNDGVVAENLFAGERDLRALMRARDWSDSPLGQPATWPQSLRSVVGLMLANRHLMFVAWGPELAFLYNDGYRPVLGAKHPWALGRPFREVWPEIWDDIKPLIDTALSGQATWSENLPLVMERNGYPEDCWFTFSYSPVRDESGAIAGLFCAGAETTHQVVEQRRQAFRISLDEALRNLVDAREIMAVSAERLGRELAADRAGYGEVDPDDETFVVERDWSRGEMAIFAGRHRLDDFGPELVAAFRAGRTVSLEDILHEPLTAGEDVAQAFEAITMRSAITVPLIKAGRLAAGLYVHCREPRRWTLAEEALVGEVAERTWAAVERARAEAALRESEARFKSALEAASAIGTWDWDMVNDRVYADERFARLYSVDPARAAAGAPIAEFLSGIHPEDRESAGADIQAAIDTASELQTEYPLLQPDGTLRWALARGRVAYGPDGAPLRFAGVTVDITQRKLAEQEAQRIAAEFEALAENIPMLAWMAEPDGDIFWYNRRWYEYTGASLETQEGWGWESAHDPALLPSIAAEWRRSLSTGEQFDMTFPLRGADGVYRTFLTRAVPIRDEAGRIVRWFGTNVDVTEQHEAEARQLFFLSLADCVRRLSDPRDIVAAAVGALGRHLGVSRVGFGEMSADDQTVAFETDYADGVAHLVGSFPTENFGRGNFVDLRRGHTTTYADVTLDPRTRDADWAAIEARSAMAAPLIRDGRLSAVLYLNDRSVREWKSDEVTLVEEVAARTWDALERARAEAALHQLNARLEARVVERTAELEQSQEALRQAQKMEAVGQLTGGIAHDFNNMLAVVIGSLDLLGRRVGVTDPRARRYIDAASDGARRAALLTQRLLAFSRQQPLRPEPIDANKLVTGMSELLRGSLGSDIRFETVLAGGHWRVHVDPNQLENVLLNLAVNARDAMPGGGRLTIETQNSHLDARYAAAHLGVPAGQYVLIAVTDTGSGMPAEVIARAFDPFFTTKEVGKGTGLGLSQVYGFVKQSGGHVKIYSEPDQGTTVKIYLPRLMTADGETAEEASQAEMPFGEQDEVVLVVEDEPGVRQFSVDALGELGYRVLEADGAAAALRLLDAHEEIALLFTDIIMPDVNGRKLADEARLRRPELKVLFTTGYTRNAVVHNGVLDPGVELIGKPFTIEELAAKVREVLDA